MSAIWCDAMRGCEDPESTGTAALRRCSGSSRTGSGGMLRRGGWGVPGKRNSMCKGPEQIM